ncbi:ribulose-phosphate 3-epimerase [Candidatus Woesearchaeota archaeon]|nr:ribulose-phosphate 3-epimerase [Candidatus Woesearchaeota archaeon]
MVKNKIVPAIIAKSQEELDKRIDKVKDYFEILQLDVMDGIFVPTHSIDFDFKLPKTKCRYEAHLMVDNPYEWIVKNNEAADIFLVHIESCREPEKVIGLVRSKGKKIGFVINPKTPLEKIKPYLDRIDQVLVMTVDPGYYGSPFLPEALDKVRELRELKPGLDIEVDGGINADTIKKAYQAGANLFVCGSYLQKSGDVKKAAEGLEKAYLN